MDVLLDNTSFAGTIRTLLPDRPEHISFLEKYKNFRALDELSFCEFLNALCIFDSIRTDATSKVTGDEIIENANLGTPVSWVDNMSKYLPAEVQYTLENGEYAEHTQTLFIERSLRVISSPMKEKIMLSKDEKIPNIYYDSEYFQRPEFEEIIKRDGLILTEDEKVQAMFLHRGLYLVECATQRGWTYQPHYLRGKVLSKISPAYNLKRHGDGIITPDIPGARDSKDDDYSRELNKYYFELLKKLTWKEYDDRFPFVGRAIYDSVDKDPNKALERALEFREKRNFKSFFEELEDLRKQRKAPQFERVVDDFKKELELQAAEFGLDYQGASSKAWYKFLVSAIPAGKVVDAGLQAILQSMPRALKEWWIDWGNELVDASPMQTLFAMHVEAIRNT